MKRRICTSIPRLKFKNLIEKEMKNYSACPIAGNA